MSARTVGIWRAARRHAVYDCLGEIMDCVRALNRGVLWGECTAEAAPLAARHRRALAELEAARMDVHYVLDRIRLRLTPSALTMPGLVDRIAAAWRDVGETAGTWHPLCEQASGERAVGRLRALVLGGAL